MAGRIVKVRVAHPGTMEQHITDFLMDSNQEFTREQMVFYWKLDNGAFYTDENGKKAFLVVARSDSGVEYVKTKPDSTTKNNLLNLPRF